MKNLICFDIESCDGGSIGSLCSLGYITAENSKITDKHDLLVNPACGFNPMLLGSKYFKLQYKKSVYRSSPTFDKYYDKIKELFSNRLVVGFSIANDVRYLNDACMYYGLPFIDYDFIDVQTLLALHLNERRNYSLKDAADMYSIEFIEHSSADDAEASFKVLCGILSKENLSLDCLLDKYSVVLGRNQNGIFYPCRSSLPAVATVTDSKNAINKLNNEFLRGLEPKIGEFCGNIYCFEESFEQRKDFRSILNALYNKGGICVFNVLDCTHFIKNDVTFDSNFNANLDSNSNIDNNADNNHLSSTKNSTISKRLSIAQNRHKKIINESSFLKSLGEYSVLTFDDEQILLDKKAREQQERIDQYLANKKA